MNPWFNLRVLNYHREYLIFIDRYNILKLLGENEDVSGGVVGGLFFMRCLYVFIFCKRK